MCALRVHLSPCSRSGVHSYVSFQRRGNEANLWKKECVCVFVEVGWMFRCVWFLVYERMCVHVCVYEYYSQRRFDVSAARSSDLVLCDSIRAPFRGGLEGGGVSIRHTK